MTRLIKGWLLVALVGVLIPITPPVIATTAPPPPPSAPPANLAATTGSTRVTLVWQAVGGATGYQIFRASLGYWDALPVATVSQPTFVNTGLTSGTPYTYKVAAFNSGGSGPLSNEVNATPMAPPTDVAAAAGDRRVTLTWQPSAGAWSYNLYRSTSTADGTFVPVVTNLMALGFFDTGLANGTKYYYRVSAIAPAGVSALSPLVFATPLPPPPGSAPANLVATPANARVTLSWNAVGGAITYRVFRTTTGVFGTVPIASVTTTTFTNIGLTNGTAYSYRVAANNTGGDGPSSEVTATPLGPPAAPTNLTAAGGDQQVTIAWTPSANAAAYNVYRGTRPGRQASTPVATIAGPPFADTGLENGPTFYYKITATNVGGEGVRSTEVSATTEGPPLVIDAETTAAFRVLRQATWGPRPGDVDHLKTVGVDAFLDAQFAAPASAYPAILFNLPIELAQEHFMSLALTEPDQLRQRVAWALHKIWVVSAVEVSSAPAIVTYYRLLMDGAFGNYRDLMREITLNPAMGRYLNMLNNRSQQVTGVPPNENYPRELMQLFTLGIAELNPDGRPVLDANGAPVPAYTETDVQQLARILTGWTFGGPRPTSPVSQKPEVPLAQPPAVPVAQPPAVPFAQPPEVPFAQPPEVPLAQPPEVPLSQRPEVPLSQRPEVPLSQRAEMSLSQRPEVPLSQPPMMTPAMPEGMLANTGGSSSENYRVPMVAIEADHDPGAKTFLGESFPAGQSASQDLEQALDVLFNHPNLPPFVSRQLIQQLVTSNPSPAYVQDIAAVFSGTGMGTRGDLAAVVRAILTHPEASATTPTAGKLTEPVLFLVSMLRALEASVADHPFMADKVEEMGQKVFYPPSVFSYFSPGYRVRGTAPPGGQPLGGPEFQILTSVTALVRTNFVGDVLGGHFYDDVLIDYNAFTTRARDAAVLVDYCNLLFMGGRMSVDERREIITAVRATPFDNATERVRTALYLTLAIAQSQVDR